MSEQGEFARGYLHALASAAGLIVSAHDAELDGVDLGFRFPARVFPAIEAQVAWSTKAQCDGGEWCFDGLDEVRFNRLAGDDCTVPRYLFLIILPPDRSYTIFDSDGMVLRHLGYFHSLRNESPVAQPDRARCRRVRVPTANVLTAPRMLSLLRGAA